MTQQTEAQRLADALMALHEAKKYHPSGPGGQMCGSEQYRLVTSGLAFEDLQNAAALLRRQDELLWRALEAMEEAHDQSLDGMHLKCRQTLLAQISSIRAHREAK